MSQNNDKFTEHTITIILINKANKNSFNQAKSKNSNSPSD